MPTNSPIPGFEPESPAWREAFFRDPYPAYTALLAADRPVWLPHSLAESRSAGVWLFSRHAHAVEIFHDTRHFSKDIARVRTTSHRTLDGAHLLLRDGADHARLRRMMAPWFSDSVIRDLAPIVRECVEMLLQQLAVRDVCDLVTDFAEPLPQLVIARFLGLPADDLPTIRRCALLLAPGLDSLLVAEPGNQAARAAGAAEFREYLEDRLANAGRLAPGSIVRRLLDLRDAGELTHAELVATLGLLTFAGHETTISLLASGLLLLIRHPDQRLLLATQPALVDSAIEEILRYESPEQRTTFRVATAPVSVGGHDLAAGDQVGIVIGAANRDEAVFADAGRFDITRTPNPHLAFGAGSHVCLGKGLARLEARIALPLLLERFPQVALADEPPRWRRESFFRSLQRLAVRLAPASLRPETP